MPIYNENSPCKLFYDDKEPAAAYCGTTEYAGYDEAAFSNGESIFSSEYNALLPSLGIEGNSMLDGETHTFHDFGGEFEIVNSGKNLFSGVKVNGQQYGWGNYLVYAVPLKAGKSYYMSYSSETTGTFPEYIYFGVSDNGAMKWRYDDIKTCISNCTYNGFRYLTTLSSGSERPRKRLDVVKDCTLIIYRDGRTITGFTERFADLMVEVGNARTEFEPYRAPQTIGVDMSAFRFREQYSSRDAVPVTASELRRVNDDYADVLSIEANDTWMEWDEERQEPTYGYSRRGVFLHRNVSVITYTGEDLEGFDWVAAEIDDVTGLPVMGSTVYVGGYYDSAVYYDTESEAAKALLRLAQKPGVNVFSVGERNGADSSTIYGTYYSLTQQA